MFCINCHNTTTGVTNSRPHKKEPKVWRRRRCTRCHADFTTQEKPVLDAAIHVFHAKSGKNELFYQGKLIHSIMRSFAHDEYSGIINALPLSDTVISALLPIDKVIPAKTIASTCYKVISRFDKTAAAQYALIYGVAATPTRGRKSAQH